MTKKNDWKGWLYLAPIIILMLVFTFYPLIRTIILSFDPVYETTTHRIHFSQLSFKNYKDILIGVPIEGGGRNTQNFGNSLTNTLLIVFISVPISTILALAISVSLMSIKKVRSFFQTIFFLPYVTNTIAIGMVFSVMFSYNGGLINLALSKLGISPINWIDNAAAGGGQSASKLAMMTTALTYIIWSGLPFKILIFMGGLQSINKQYYQAAQIDSASKWTVFRKVTVPLLSPLIMYIVITSLIGSFKTYAAIIGLFPPNSSELTRMNTMVGYVYDQLSKTNGGYQRGAAGAVILFLIILLITAVNMYIGKKKVHY